MQTVARSSNRRFKAVTGGLLFRLLGVGLGLGTLTAIGADTNSPAKATTEIVIPRSDFKVGGRDPFFPSRLLGSDTTTRGPKTNDVVGPIRLVLQGITGTPEKRIALINGRTFAAGETADVKDDSGRKVKITCTEIREDGVTVKVEGESEPRELKLLKR